MNNFLNLPKLPELDTTEPAQNDLDVEPYTTSEGYVFVPVACGDLTGWYSLFQHKVVTGESIYTPTGFECAGGRENNRKWRISIRVLLPDGSRGVTLGHWLFTHGLEHMVPSTKPRGSQGPQSPTKDSPSIEPYPSPKSGSNRSSPQKRNRKSSVSITATSGGASMNQNALKYESPTKQRRTQSIGEVSDRTRTATGHVRVTDANRAELISAYMRQRLALSSPVAPGITAPPTTPVFMGVTEDCVRAVRAAAIATASMDPGGASGPYATTPVLSSRVLALPRPAISPQKFRDLLHAVELPGAPKLQRSEASNDLVNAFEGMEAALESPDGVEAQHQILLVNDGNAPSLARAQGGATSPQENTLWENKLLKSAQSEDNSPTAEWEKQIQMAGAEAKAAAAAASPKTGRSPPSPPPEMLSNASPVAHFAAEDASSGPAYITTPRFEAFAVIPGGCDSSGDGSTHSCQEISLPRAERSLTDVSK